MKRKLMLSTILLAISMPVFADDVPVSDADEMPAEIAELAQLTLKQPPPLKSLPAKQDPPTVQEPAPLFKDDAPIQKLVAAESTLPAAAAPKEDLLTDMQTLQNEIKQLRGLIEIQKHELKQLTEQQSTQIKELEDRIAVKTKTLNAPKGDPEKLGLEEPSTEQESAKEAEVNKTYQEAFALVRDKKYVEASIAMEAFIKAFPETQYTANALYWLGELYLAQGFMDKGIVQFNRVTKEFPTSSKASAATLKLGYSYYDQSRWAQARAQFATVLKNYPNSSEASLAKNRLHELDRQGL